MILYSLMMFLIFILFLIISIIIYNGNTHLIHDYYQTKVKDKQAYSKAFGKALSVISLTSFISGIIALISNKVIFAIIILLAGIFLSIVCLIKVQNKYNQGIF